MGDSKYSGAEALAISIDVGTTSTAVSFIHLEDGVIPRIRSVSKWPDQEDASGNTKIPSLVYYDEDLEPIAYGAECSEEDVIAEADSRSWQLARWFKLHLHPKFISESLEGSYVDGVGAPSADPSPFSSPRHSLVSEEDDDDEDDEDDEDDDDDDNRSRTSNPYSSGALFDIPPMPQGVSVRKVYRDFFRYIFQHTRNFFENNIPDGQETWARLADSITFIVAHPNGWDIREQKLMSEALVGAGLIQQGQELERLYFIREAEASVHYVVCHSDAQSWLKPGSAFLVCDAGGSTVDLALYRCRQVSPKLELEEIRASGCVQAGSVFVTREFEKMIAAKLKFSKFAGDRGDYINTLVDLFDRRAKRKFSGPDEPCHLKFASTGDTDPTVNVSRGRLTLNGAEIQAVFNPCVDAIMQEIENQIEGVTEADNLKHFLLVGGFGESPYLLRTMKEKYGPLGIQIVTADEATTKAVAEGSSLAFVKQVVVARATRYHYGLEITELCAPDAPNPDGRRVLAHAEGSSYLDGVWGELIAKDTVVQADEVRSKEFGRIMRKNFEFKAEIFAWEKDGSPPHYVYEPDYELVDGFRSVCVIKADLLPLKDYLEEYKDEKGEPYWIAKFNIEFLFGQTALSARFVWDEDGERREGPVSMIPDAF